MIYLRTWLALFCLGCGGTYAWHAPMAAEVPVGASPQRVTNRQQYLNARDVPVGWRRPDDPVAGEMYFLFSDQGYGCAVTAADFTMARDGDDWLCVWRRYH